MHRQTLHSQLGDSRLTRQLIAAATAFGLAFAFFSHRDTLAQELDASLATRTTVADVQEALRMYRDIDRQVDQLQAAIEQLEHVRKNVENSMELSKREKSRWSMAVGRRIDSLSSSIRKLERADEAPTSIRRDERVQGSAGLPQDRYAPSSTRQNEGVPLGWRQWRRWDGGGALPGGSWSGSEYQETWGFNISDSSTATMSDYDSQRSEVTQGTDTLTLPKLDLLSDERWSLMGESRLGRNDGNSSFNWRSGSGSSSSNSMDSFAWPSLLQSGNLPLQSGNLPQSNGMTFSRGGTSVGGGASASARASGSSRTSSFRSAQSQSNR